jgi:hypothetical protein
MTSPWIITAAGRRFDLLCPSLEQVDLQTIAAATAKLCRWTGHISQFYSVASHSVAVARICAIDAKPYALLHDSAEAYLGDVSTPLKHAMRALSPAALAAYDQITEVVERAIHLAFGLQWPVPSEIHAEIKRADLVMLATEYRDLIPGGSPALDVPATLPPPDEAFLFPDYDWQGAMHHFLDIAWQYHEVGLLPLIPGRRPRSDGKLSSKADGQ